MFDGDPRIFVEWYDDKRPGWGGYVSTLDRDFVQAVNEMVSELGAPTKVEFRLGWKHSRMMDPHGGETGNRCVYANSDQPTS